MNAARFVFLDPRSQTFYRDWEATTRQIVAILRAEAGRSPYDRQLSDLVGELSTRSDLFRRLWGGHTMSTSIAPASSASTTRSWATST